MILTYKYRIKDRAARKALRRHAWAVNQVWNYCVAYQRDVRSRFLAGAPKRKWPSNYDLHKLTAGTSADLGICAQSINEVCRYFVRARDGARGTLRFRASSGTRRALGWVPFRTQSRQINGNSVTYRGKQYRFWEGRRPLPAAAKGGSFVEDACGRWYVCFHIDLTEDRPTGNAKIGIDLGLKSMAACSDGYVIEAPRIYRRHEHRLAIAQRAGNKRRIKAIHCKIKNCRRDFIHKATTALARDNALIVVGNVNSSKLAKTRFAKSVLDAGWSMFRSQLRYKASRHGAVYLDVDEKFTTVTCSACGERSGPQGQKGLRIREWSCVECGAAHDRDHNSAKNILALSAQRRDDESRRAA